MSGDENEKPQEKKAVLPPVDPRLDSSEFFAKTEKKKKELETK